MKRLLITLFAIGMVTMSSMSMAAMSVSNVRKNTRFLTDKMAYELNLSTNQYDDVYEVNFDFIYNVRHVLDDAMRGNDRALDAYYQALDLRNDDLRWVLSNSQYRRFLGIDYFYRPIYTSGRSWNFRVYVTYTNRNYFYFGKPYHYRDYCGGHYRNSNSHVSYYKDRYHHDVYNGHFSTQRENVYQNNRRQDFGTRPSSSSTRPSTPRSSGTTTRPGGSTNSRPSATESERKRPSSSTERSSDSKSKDRTTVTERPSSGNSNRSSSNSRSSGSSSSSSRGSSERGSGNNRR